MNCNVCKEHQPALKHWASLELCFKGGKLEVFSICETCAGKIEDFLKSLGWRLS